MRASPGSPTPLGATWDGSGVNFAIYSRHASGVELCLYDSADDPYESIRVPIVDRTDDVWHVYLPDARPGQLYGYRVAGPWSPFSGHRFNAAKMLLDPYARAIGRDVSWHPSLFSYAPGTDADGAQDHSDSAAHAPLAIVVDHAFDWNGDTRPSTPLRDTVIYEMHVKGFSALHPAVPEDLRGTYLGLADPASIQHLTSLGVTAVELLPVHAHADEWRLVQAGLTNYWRYNTLAFFAPSPTFAAGRAPLDPLTEFKTMVRALHAAGIEVILDVVYNHTAEGDHLGPTFSMRGIDNSAYYRLEPEQRGRYENYTGCGNTIDTRSPAVRGLILDSLRYWAEEMHVDGFRFDLAVSLARGERDFDPNAPILDAIASDPSLSSLKVIAEAWDVGPDGYQVGRFPAGWSEWNDHYRNDIRRFWRGDGRRSTLATRLAGSSDLFDRQLRGPLATVNFVTAHDGFTLRDLVSFNEKHNEANGEDNRDGENNNYSWNSGVEGPAADPATTTLRDRQRRNVLMTLLVSLGIPMISGGDELGRTQHGNNNAYCHDSPLTWTPWSTNASDESLLGFAKSVLAFRAAQPVLRRETFFRGAHGTLADVRWLGRDGRELRDADWQDEPVRALGVLLDGDAVGELDPHGTPIAGDTVLLLFNGHEDGLEFQLPEHAGTRAWEVVLDTAAPGEPVRQAPVAHPYVLAGRSAAALRIRRTNHETSG